MSIDSGFEIIIKQNVHSFINRTSFNSNRLLKKQEGTSFDCIIIVRVMHILSTI